MSYQQPPPNTGYQQPSGPQQQPGMYPQQQPIQPGGYLPYQQPPMMPPGPPQRPPVKKLSRRTWLIIGVVVLVLIIIGAVSNAGKSTATPTSVAPTATPIIVNAQATATPVPATATAIPTAKPTKATSSAIIPTHGTPLLGGPISDFYGKYGQPNNHTSDQSYHWFRDDSSNVDGLIVWNLTHYPQVDSIGVQAINGDMPDTNAAIALCTVYNPSDAHQLKNIPLVNASGQASGFDVIYVSTSLAQTFAAADFTDANGNTVQRGSFDIQYLYKGDGTQSIDSCSILPGEQQTTG